jgi:hypothetical protein
MRHEETVMRCCNRNQAGNAAVEVASMLRTGIRKGVSRRVQLSKYTLCSGVSS